MLKWGRVQWRFTTLRPVVVDCGYGMDFFSICTGMKAEDRPRNCCLVSCGATHRLILFLGREELCPMVLIATLLQIKYKQVDGGLPDAARLRGGVYADLLSTIQPFD